MEDINTLVGKKILQIYISDDHLCFVTDHGMFAYEAYADCCSTSYFYDFIGVENLLKNGKVIAVEEVAENEVTQPKIRELIKADVLQLYGYRITTLSNKFGEVSSVFSFRNDSNGFYGGWINPVTIEDVTKMKEITTDWVID